MPRELVTNLCCRCCCLFAWLLLAVAPAAPAQELISPVHIAAVWHALEFGRSTVPLSCKFTLVRPSLDFALRFRTGYVVRFPMSQFGGAKHSGNILLNVTPEGGSPGYLISSVEFPVMSETTLTGQVSGEFVVGEGNYRVDALVQDDLNRVCRGQWLIRARRKLRERPVKLALPPLTVAASTSRPISNLPKYPALNRLTILMHAASLSAHTDQLRPSDISTLIDSLSSLLQQLPARTVTLVVFNLEQQRILFSKDGFTASGIDDVAKAIKEQQLGLINYSVLQQQGGAVELLKSLVQEEFSRPAPSDVLVFLGPHAEMHDRIPTDMVKAPGRGPRVFFVECRPPYSFLNSTDDPAASPAAGSMAYDNDPVVYMEPAGASLLSSEWGPDGIEQLVKGLRGDVMIVRQPPDLVRAIKHIASRFPH